jgi:REP element-mobilizing transposase RayT
MAGTHTQLYYHIIFSTKHRAQLIYPELLPRLHEYLGGIIHGEGGTALEIGGTADHVHLLARCRPDVALSELLRRVKRNSSEWLHKTVPSAVGFAWQEGYAAFTVSASGVDSVRRYIASQAEHHHTQTFQEEFVAFLQRHGVQYDPRYIWT